MFATNKKKKRKTNKQKRKEKKKKEKELKTERAIHFQEHFQNSLCNQIEISF